MRGINVTDGYTRDQVRKAIVERRAELGGLSWHKFGQAVGVSGVMLNAVANSKKPPSDAVLVAFGFTPKRVVEVEHGYDVAPVCAKCGVVHVTKTCTAARKRRVRTINYVHGGVRYHRHAGTDQL